MSTEAVLNFATNGSKTAINQIQVDWAGKNLKLGSLLVTVCTVKTGELVFLLIPLNPTDTVVELPLQLDTKAGTVKVSVYGLKDKGHPNHYSIVSSGVIDLTKTNTGNMKGKCRVDLPKKHKEGRTFTDLKEKGDEFKIGIKQQPPSWYYVSDLPTTGSRTNPGNNHFLTVLQQKSPFEETLVLKVTPASNCLIPAELPPLTDFAAKVYWLDPILQTSSFKLFTLKKSSDTPYFRTYLSFKDLERLYQRAMSLVPKNRKRAHFHEIRYFYRNKPVKYYENIFKNRRGVMEKYCKDFNGDRGSSINGNIEGLFFGTGVDPKTQQPPDFSYYGEQRLHIPAYMLFHEGTNLYFADFYCHYEVHYVTLVLTEKGSSTDVFCKSRLLPVDPYDNPFLYKYQMLSICVTSKLHVEVFYTENLCIGAMLAHPDVFFKYVRTMGAGKSKPMGIPKNASCKICNLK